MQQKTIPLGPAFAGVELGYLDWGDPAAPRRVVCVHGLTRNAHDFDSLAEALASRGCRVLAVDVAGRGRSSWLADPTHYAVPVYAAQLARFLELLGLTDVDWIGTSMGGLIGMVLAAGKQPPMARLIINDIGPFVPMPALQQIQAYLGLDLRFKDRAELEAHLRKIHASFGPLTDAQWHKLAQGSARETPEGWRLNYDPAIRKAFDASADVAIWELWDQIRIPTFVMRGGESTLLTTRTLEQMQRRGPPVEVATISGVGHAPALMARDQIDVIEGWLDL